MLKKNRFATLFFPAVFLWAINFCLPDMVFAAPPLYKASIIIQGVGLDINNEGQVVGSYTMNSLTQAFVWDKKEGLKDLGFAQDGYSARARAINDLGQIIGEYWNSTTRPIIYIWEEKSGYQKIDGLTDAVAINNNGIIVGSVRVPGDIFSVIWKPGEGIRYLTNNGRGMDINDHN
ncbi:MAG: hypothetical protein HZA78_00755 [Candidatus Schekmanbacteria bacterium]|nr:hypothetical protein [Candidatus Schekmanbacteria bacterium]